MENKKKVNKRLESTKKYIDGLQSNYSKINTVRVDFGYKNPYSKDTTLNDMKVDINHLVNNRRTKKSIFDHNIGYIIKIENGESKGIHGHAIFIYDGNKVQKDAFKGDQIGKYWEKLTKGKGSFHNCNRSSYARNGTGMLSHNDTDKRKILDEDVISYLCKDEQKIEAIKENKKDRVFTRGTISKVKRNIGRPRISS